ncbi:MAG: alpha/beta hydrolase-fold protein [Bacteroidota bacterium]
MIYLFLTGMHEDKTTALLTEEHTISSEILEHAVTISCFLPRDVAHPEEMGLLLINDGQNMEELGLAAMLDELIGNNTIEPLVCVAIHSGIERKVEYGTARCTDYMGRGAKAALYTQFIFEELLPFIHTTYAVASFKSKSFAGFSLGGLSALDIVWNHPGEFLRAGVFSGSLWWRTRGLEDGYNEETDRIMHMQVKEGGFYPWLKFFFETGALDETMDRNHNGIIDSIDDTLGLIDDLISKGYDAQNDIHYLEMQDGRHDIATWAKAMPEFLKWGWGTGISKD